MSAADHTDLLFMPRKQMIKSRRFISFTIWMILIISFFVSIAYWWTLSCFEDAVNDPNISWFTLFLLLMTVGTGAATELVKTVSLGYARNKKLWIYATIVSVITVMGTYSILDYDRKQRLSAGSAVQTSNVQANASNDAVIAATRHAANYDVSALEAELAENKRAYRFEKKYSKPLYLSIKADLDKKIQDYNAYHAAISAQTGLRQTVTSGGAAGVVTNPLLNNVAKLIANGKTNIVVMAFYLAVTVLLEWAAYTLGGRIEAIDVYLQNVEAHIADLTNMRVFGTSMKQVNNDIARGAIHGQRQRIQFDKEMKRAVLEQTDDSGNSMTLQETNEYVNKLNGQSAVTSQHGGIPVSTHSVDTLIEDPNARANLANTVQSEGSSLDGLSHADLVAKHAAAVANNGSTGHCVTCDAEFNRNNRSLYCSPDHSREYQKVLKRAKRAEGIT